MTVKEKEKSRIKISKITIEQVISTMQNFDKDSEARIYQLPHTERTDGYMMICIDIPRNFIPEVREETPDTEPTNNDI
jgi:hypothetical protein